MTRVTILAAAALLAAMAAGCGDPALQSTAPPTEATGCPRDAVEGCTMLGLRLEPPLALEEALAVAGEVGGTAIAVYRTDAVCVPAVQFSAVAEPEKVASRFAYVDAEDIAERRLDAVDGGLAPPISGFHISQSYWDAWEAEWRAAQRAGVLIEGVAVWIGDDAAVADPRVVETVPLAWRRTDSVDPSYAGELLMDSEAFPGLSRPADPGC